MFELFANLLIAGTVAASLVVLNKRRSPLILVGTVAATGLASLFFASFLNTGMFSEIRVLAWAVFGHGVILLAGGAILLRTSHRKTALTAAILAGLVVLVGIDAFLIEPHWLQITRHRIVTSKVKRSIKLAIVADFQTDEIGDYEEESLRLVMAEKPDLILLAGDYVQADKRSAGEMRNRLNRALTTLNFQGSLGAVAVQGNCDTFEWTVIFKDTKVTCVEETGTLEYGEVRVTALSVGDSFNERLRVDSKPGFHIVVGHAPDFALGDVRADLLVAGHTHGGQVRLPFIGPLMTLSEVPRSWAAGVTDLGGGRTLIVSRGIGMERGNAPRLRFLCRPELVIVEVVPAP